jgi:UDP-N-acetyl-D-mannosaminuronate dehydrogenase
MPSYVVTRLMQALNRRRQAMNGARVLLLGLGYKPNSGDCRESPALKVAELLRELGATVAAVDPFVEAHHVPADVELVALTADTVAAADAVVLLTDHDGVPYELLDRATLVFDTRRRLTTPSAEHL